MPSPEKHSTYQLAHSPHIHAIDWHFLRKIKHICTWAGSSWTVLLLQELGTSLITLMAVVGCKIEAQQHEELYQLNRKDQANFCEVTLLSAGVMLLHVPPPASLSNIKLCRICSSWGSDFHLNREEDLYAPLPAPANASHLLAVVQSQPSPAQISDKAVQ